MRLLIIVLLCSLYCCPLGAQQPKLMLPIGHTGSIDDACFSPDGKKILTSSFDKTAKIWDSETGILLANLKGHKENLTSAEFSSDGNRILTVARDGKAMLWNAANGQLIQDLQKPKTRVARASFSRDGRLIVTAVMDSMLLFNGVTGKFIKSFWIEDDMIFSAKFSPDAKEIVTTGGTSEAYVWNVATGATSYLEGHNDAVNWAEYSPDGKSILTIADDSTALLWKGPAWEPKEFRGKGKMLMARYSPDNAKVATVSEDNMISIWSAANGKPLRKLGGYAGEVHSMEFSKDGTKIIACYNEIANIWDVNTGKSLNEIPIDIYANSARFSADGSKIVFGFHEKIASVWDISKNDFILLLDGHTSEIYADHFSPDGTKILTAGEDGVARIWDAATGEMLKLLTGHLSEIYSAEYSRDGSRIITASDDSTVRIWDANTGKQSAKFRGFKAGVNYAAFNSDGKKAIAASNDSTIKIWGLDPATNKWKTILILRGHTDKVNWVAFSPDESRIVSFSAHREIKTWDARTGACLATVNSAIWIFEPPSFSADSKTIMAGSDDKRSGKKFLPQSWDAVTGKPVANAFWHDTTVAMVRYSPDGQKLLTIALGGSAKIWNPKTGALQGVCKGLPDIPFSIAFSPDGQKIVMSFIDNAARVWDANTGVKTADLLGHGDDVNSAEFSPDGRYILTGSSDNTLKKWDAVNGQLLYTFFPMDSTDYLVIDKYDRYDGTAAARRLLYFTCGTEVIELEQFKDLTWEPGLVKKVMGLSTDPITAKKLSEVQICNVTPVVVQKNDIVKGVYEFTIIPRNGGVGQVQLFVNGKQVSQFAPSTLPKNDKGYQLSIKHSDLQPYFSAGLANRVSVKATTTEGTMTSRGGEVVTPKVGNKIANPNIYIVSVGINEYKGTRLKLNYASTDAESFAAAVEASAKNLLNADGKEHVNTYTLSTEEKNQNKPSKEVIRKTLEKIAGLATPDDILIIFFAGHGALIPGQRNLYLLTMEASSLELKGVEKEVAISTEELNGWMRNIKANKQLLILDACNSGAAIQDTLVKRDVPADQVRALENLKDKAGIFILSASASGQSAYESSQFGQGLLTYSLLSGIKYQTGLKENKYIDVTRWFNFASDNVRDLAREIGGRQDPQIIGNASFDVGLVDKTVMDGIKLSSTKKKIFSRPIFYTGDRDLLIDDLELAREIDKELKNQSARGKESAFTYIENFQSPDAYSIRGNYEVANNSITVKVSLVYKNKKVGSEFVKTGTVEKRDVLAKQIVADVVASLGDETGPQKN